MSNIHIIHNTQPHTMAVVGTSILAMWRKVVVSNGETLSKLSYIWTKAKSCGKSTEFTRQWWWASTSRKCQGQLCLICKCTTLEIQYNGVAIHDQPKPHILICIYLLPMHHHILEHLANHKRFWYIICLCMRESILFIWKGMIAQTSSDLFMIKVFYIFCIWQVG